MKAKGILTAVLAAGVLLLAPGFDGARADQNNGHRHSYQQTHNGNGYGYGNGHAYGLRGQQHFGDQRHGGHAYGKRARTHFGDGLTRHDRTKLRHLRHRFDNDQAFRRYLRHNKPGLYGRYMGQNHQRQRYADGQRRHSAQRYTWYRGQTRQTWRAY